jgi:hypothetical protein
VVTIFGSSHFVWLLQYFGQKHKYYEKNITEAVLDPNNGVDMEANTQEY